MTDAPVALVTGATGGIGRALCLALAGRGYVVVPAVRDARKAEPLLRALAETPGAPRGAAGSAPAPLLVDFASLASVRAAADDFLARHDRLDVLLLNAGTFSWRRARSADGFERTLAVNLLGPAALADRLVPLLRATAACTGDARIVSTTSVSRAWGVAARTPRFFRRYPGFHLAYGASKLGLVLHARALCDELAGTGVTAACFDPGLVATPILSGGSLLTRPISRLLLHYAGAPEEGAATGVRLAADPAFHGLGGIVLGRHGESRLPRRMRDPATARRFLAAVRAAVAEAGAAPFDRARRI